MTILNKLHDLRHLQGRQVSRGDIVLETLHGPRPPEPKASIYQVAGFWSTIIGFFMAIGLVIAIIFWVFPSYMEARSFTAITGKPVSTWQAMWVELRIQDGAVK